MTKTQFALLKQAIEDCESKSDEPDFQECFRHCLREGQTKITEVDFKAIRDFLFIREQTDALT